MTVAQLIEELEKIEDKTLPVGYPDEWMGGANVDVVIINKVAGIEISVTLKEEQGVQNYEKTYLHFY